MVFSSLPPYHHDPANWQQQPNHSSSNSQLHQPHVPPPPPPPALPPPPQPHGGGGAGSIRPGSMADRARMANIPMPEAALKCPRCESTNTKFCYFNNYSLTQPRHFCKTCRRYWTRGGALRSVPVGGGCRRNKRSKGSGSGSKSSNPAASSERQAGGGSASSGSSGAIPSNAGSSAAELLGLAHQLPALRFMAPLHHPVQLADFASPAGAGEIGLNYGLSYGGAADLNFHIGSVSASLFPGNMADQWRLQPPPPPALQFPFLASGMDASAAAAASGLFEGEAASFGGRPKATSSGITQQMASVKMEDSNNSQSEMNLSRQFNNMGSTDHYWNGGVGNSSACAWTTDLSAFSSSSTTSNQL